jgi:hypothetical protein
MTIRISFFKAPTVHHRGFEVEEIFLKALNRFSENLTGTAREALPCLPRPNGVGGELHQVSRSCRHFDGARPIEFCLRPTSAELLAIRLSPSG